MFDPGLNWNDYRMTVQNALLNNVILSTLMPQLIQSDRDCAAPESMPIAGSVQASHDGRLTICVVRLLDILVSSMLLLVLAPLLLVIALLIRIDSAGSALYWQERLGLGGKPFMMVKFRSMRVDAEADGPSWASVGDQRITRAGKYLRRTRLDELPQLFNVLRGDMAFIGPRPERACFTDELSAHIPHFRLRLLVKPGVTGWAQVNLPYGASIEDARAKLAYDLHYVRNRSIWMALRILFRTVRVMFAMAGR